MPGPARSVVTAVDATPLLGVQTGVGVSVAGFIAAVSSDPGVDIVAYGLSARRWTVAAGRVARIRSGPDGRSRSRPLPCSGPGSASTTRWSSAGPAPVDVVHGTNFVVPPSRRAARLVTVHDLTSVHFPELCSPTSLRYPGLIRRALGQGASVHAVSQSMADEIVDSFRLDPERVHVDPQRVDAAAAAAARDESDAAVHPRSRDRRTAQRPSRSGGCVRSHRRLRSRPPTDDRRAVRLG